MKILIFIVVLLAIAIGLTLYAGSDPGYVLIARSQWSIEMSLLDFALLLVVLFGVLYLLGRLMRRLWLIPQNMADWRLSRNTKKARTSLTQGLLRLAEGNWTKAQNNGPAPQRQPDHKLSRRRLCEPSFRQNGRARRVRRRRPEGVPSRQFRNRHDSGPSLLLDPATRTGAGDFD